jgi:hypothetical protein
MLSSFVSNILAKSHWPSSGRIVTFFFQTLYRLFHPSISTDFFASLGFVVIYGVIAIWFQRVVMKKIG